MSSNNSEISNSTRSSHSPSFTRSVLVRATIPLFTPRSVRIFRCSRVWGITLSSAAITNKPKWIFAAPAAIFLINFSWPGTSIMVMFSVRYAKPRSMVIPRFFSSASRSVLVPVKALTRDVLPWSI